MTAFIEVTPLNAFGLLTVPVDTVTGVTAVTDEVLFDSDGQAEMKKRCIITLKNANPQGAGYGIQPVAESYDEVLGLLREAGANVVRTTFVPEKKEEQRIVLAKAGAVPDAHV